MKFTRVLCGFLSLLLLLCVMPFARGVTGEKRFSDLSSPSHTVTSQKQYTVWQGMTETELVLKDQAGKRIEGHMMEIAPGAAVTAKVSYPNYYKKGSTPESRKVFAQAPVWSKKTTTGQAADFTAVTGQPVIFAINTDNFITESTANDQLTVGQACGHLIMEGNICQTTEIRARPFFAVLKDGSFAIRDANSDLSDVVEATSGRIYIVKDGKNVVDPAHSEELGLMPFNSIGLKRDGTVVVFEVDGRRSDSIGFTEMEMAEYLLAQEVYTAIILDGGGSATFASRREGDSKLTVRNQPSDGTERALGSTLLFMSNEESLYFDFSGDASAMERYKSYSYKGNDYDKTSAWKPTAGTADQVSVDTATGTLTLTKDGGNTLGYSYVQTQASSGKPLGFRPAQAEYLQIRMSLSGFAPATAGTNFGIHYYADGASTQTTNAVRYLFGAGFVFDGRSLVFTVPMAQKFRKAEFIDTLKLNFSNLSGAGTITVDYLYIGPKVSLPEQEFLYFDFQGTALDAERYRSKTYGSQNFDTVGWGFNGKKSSAPIIGEDGISFEVLPTTDNYVNTGHSPYLHTVDRNGSMTAPALCYRRGEQDWLQIRFRMKDCTAVPGLMPMLRFYFAADGSSSFVGNAKKDLTSEEMTSDTYYVVTLPLYTNTAYQNAKVIDYFRLNFQNVCALSGGTGQIVVDYIYVGSEDSLPQQDMLFMDFAEDEKAEMRYRSKTYGFQNYDKGSWAYNSKKCGKPSFSDGFMVIPVTPTTDNYVNTGHSPYVQTSDMNSALSRNVLRYKPGQKDAVQIRLKLENCMAVPGKTAMLRFFYTNDDSSSTAGYVHQTLTPSQISEGNVLTVTLPLYTAEAYVNSEYIRRVQITMQNLCSVEGEEGKILIDYIYVGSEESLPTPRHTVIFRNEDGSLLQSGTVYRGDTAVYTGKSPTKSPDATYHYSFKGWDKALSNISANTDFTAVYTATSHSYTYEKTDALTHKQGCEDCDFVEIQEHTFADGSCICGETEQKEPVLDPAWKLSHSLNLASDISINFVVPASLLEGYDMSTVYVESTVENYEGETFLGTETVRIEPIQSGVLYYFTLTGITAVQMNDTISSVLYGEKDGQPYYSNADLYSVADYAYSQLSKPNSTATLKTLCADLLRYGAKAQIYKGYRVSALADEKMTEEYKACLSNLEAVAFGNNSADLGDLADAPITWAGKTLDLDSKVCVKFVFRTSNYTGDLADLYLKVTYKDIYGETMTALFTETVEYQASADLYAFSVDALLASELRQILSVQIFAGETPVSSTFQYSPDTYGNNKSGTLLELCKALFAYSDSARAYFIN